MLTALSEWKASVVVIAGVTLVFAGTAAPWTSGNNEHVVS